MMNTFGNMFRVTTWGESHGRAMGAVIDGCPAGLLLQENELTGFLKEKDRPVEELATARQEPNHVRLLSGVHQNVSLGTPISIVINNEDFRTHDYSNMSRSFRPGHGDITYHRKFKTAPASGGGRASGRECISRLAAGYVAHKIIKSRLYDYCVRSSLASLAGVAIDDRNSYTKAVEKALDISRDKDTTGGEVVLSVSGIPAGLGSPVFHKLDAELASALMSIGGVKAIEIGSGRDSAYLKGSEMNDDFAHDGFETNNAGGVLAGISTGADLQIKLSVKPTPTIGKKQQGLNTDMEVESIVMKGRHDINFAPRVAVVAEAMIHLVIVDHLMLTGSINRDVL